MAKNSRKRPRLVNYNDTTSNSMDTSNFPEPVPALRSNDSRYNQGRSFSYSPRGDRRRSGNAKGAQGYRSDLASPERRRRGSRSRGSSMSRGSSRGKSSYSPRPSGRRNHRERGRWDRASELRREEYEDRDNRRRW